MVHESNPGWATRLASTVTQNMPAAMRESMEPVETEAKRLVYLGHPDHLERKTGALQRSITTDLASDGMQISASVGSDLTYAPVHELGAAITDKNGTTRYIPPRPFLGPAFDLKKDDVRKTLHTRVEDMIRRECA